MWVAAPSAAALLADWGAEVIKVEPPTGDPMRSVFGSLGIGDDLPNPAFALDNRGKRSVVLDLRDPDGRRAPRAAARRRPTSSSATSGPTPSTSSTSSPRRPWPATPASSTAASAATACEGEDRNRPTYDIGAFWARSGLSCRWPTATGNPLNARGGIGDHITGLAALAGVLAAVLEQRQTGRGGWSRCRCCAPAPTCSAGTWASRWRSARWRRAESRDRNQAPLMNPYRTADGRWFFFTGLEAERHIGAVCRALGRPDLLDDPRFADAAAIRRNRTEVIALLDEIIAERPLAEWAERFDREGVWWAPARTPAEVVEDPQLLANDGFVEVDGGARARARSVNGPVTFSGVSRRGRSAVPGWVSTPTRCSAELAERRATGAGPALGRS